MNSAQFLAYIPSPPQGVWQLGPVPIRAYALCIVTGIIVALWWGSRRWIARGGQPGEVLDIALWAVPFGLIGGRAYHVLTDWRYYFTDLGQSLNPPRGPIDALKIWDGGLGIWGAVALGGVGAWIACRRYGIKLPAFGDAIAPPVLLAQAIGRFGNYFNQEVYGRTTDLPWGLEIFRRVPDNLTGVSSGERIAVVHPTFLYEALWNVFVVVLLVLADRYFRLGHGRVFALYVMGYCFGRFFIELLRNDPASEPFGMGIRVNSIVSVVVFGCALAYFLAAPRGRELGLSMYRPARAAELESQGEVGYIDPLADDDAPNEPELAPSEPAAASSEPAAAPSEPATVPSEPATVPSEPATVPSEPATVPSEPATVPSEPETAVDDDIRIVSVSREIAAPAATIFALIADPAQQPRFDGNENLQEADEGQRVTKVGDRFRMTNTSGRVRENRVVEFVEDRLIAWLPSEVDKAPPGHLWRWELKAVDDDTTTVTHTYDWTRLDPDDGKRNERARSTTVDSLLASLNRLAEFLDRPGDSAAADTAEDTAADSAEDDLAHEDGGGEPDKAADTDTGEAAEDTRPNIVRRADAPPIVDKALEDGPDAGEN